MPKPTTYGPASATTAGILTTSAQTLTGNKAWQNAAADKGTLASWTPGAYTALTASTENTDINFNLARTVQFATGALATQRAFRILAPTYAFVGASTLTTAITLDVAPPVAGTNATISNLIALNATGRIDCSSLIRATGQATPTTGAGLELGYTGSVAFATAYDRGAGAYKQLNLNGLSLQFLCSGAAILAASATAITCSVPLQLKSYTVATLPASPAAGLTAFASDAGGNGPCIAMGNGSVWKRCDNTSTTVA